MSDFRLQMLERRIIELEQTVIGKTKPTDSQLSCVDQLDAFNSQFTKATEKRDKITKMMNRVTELEKYMDPTFLDDMSLSNEAKIKIILGEEDKIRATADALEKIHQLRTVLSSEQLQGISSLKDKFNTLTQKHLEQRDQTDEFCAEVKQIVDIYSATILQLSKLYVQWDQKVSQIESTS